MTEDFEAELADDERFERRLFWRELAIVFVAAVVVVVVIVVT